jgi:uncharacterized protein YecE (DUF72 family)
LRPVVVRTWPVAYVRFHGRNAAHRRAAGWQRYDYDYCDDELAAWLAPLQSLNVEADRPLAIFNNTPKGRPLGDAQTLCVLLGDAAC